MHLNRNKSGSFNQIKLRRGFLIKDSQPYCVELTADFGRREEKFSLASSLDELCKKDLETGPCRAAIRRFGYSVKEMKCIMFIYGGCQGNDNNFETEEECRKKCCEGT
ncbi:Kunitz/Bovine pancreatic trypsin inhibitor domain protein [Ostertagia ostertagi]